MFTKIVVDDLDAQASFYAAVFGQVVRHRFSGGEGLRAFEEIVMGSAAGDGPSLLLIHYADGATPHPGEAVLGFTVADVEETACAARAAGGTVRSEPRSMPAGGMKVAELADPEGHLLEIVQHL
ncbi:VOC family protein [Amycolatopsis albispora]|uniref:VOC family protein n=1 Tax=Amycolatopsis albispora TaxID=1804986 RepID=UPI001F39F448|nr:VOC family protein [Amycolatopsis albispora]